MFHEPDPPWDCLIDMQTDAAALYTEAIRYGLDIPENLHRASPAVVRLHA